MLAVDNMAVGNVVVRGVIFDAPSLTWTGEKPALSSSFTYGVTRAFIDSAPESGQHVARAVYLFAKRLSGMPELRAVAYSSERGIHLVWTFIERRDKARRQRVYEEERRLMEDFPDLTVDFTIISLDQFYGRPLLPDDVQGQIVFYRQP